MSEEEHIDRQYDCFAASRIDDTGIIRFKEHMLFHATNLNTRDAVLNYLDTVSKDESIKYYLDENDRLHVPKRPLSKVLHINNYGD